MDEEVVPFAIICFCILNEKVNFNVNWWLIVLYFIVLGFWMGFRRLQVVWKGFIHQKIVQICGKFKHYVYNVEWCTYLNMMMMMMSDGDYVYDAYVCIIFIYSCSVIYVNDIYIHIFILYTDNYSIRGRDLWKYLTLVADLKPIWSGKCFQSSSSIYHIYIFIYYIDISIYHHPSSSL